MHQPEDAHPRPRLHSAGARLRRVLSEAEEFGLDTGTVRVQYHTVPGSANTVPGTVPGYCTRVPG